MKNNTLHILLSVVLVVLLVLLSDPFMLWMPPVAVMSTLFAVTVIVCIWSGFIMRERGGDEREMYHRMSAGRVAYLSGIAVLTLALVVQGLAHKIDIWIAVALAVMVVSKLISRIYFDRYL